MRIFYVSKRYWFCLPTLLWNYFKRFCFVCLFIYLFQFRIKTNVQQMFWPVQELTIQSFIRLKKTRFWTTINWPANSQGRSLCNETLNIPAYDYESPFLSVGFIRRLYACMCVCLCVYGWVGVCMCVLCVCKCVWVCGCGWVCVFEIEKEKEKEKDLPEIADVTHFGLQNLN